VAVHAARAVAANRLGVCHLALRTEFFAVYQDAAHRPLKVHAARVVAANHPEVCHLALRTEFSAVYPDAAPQPLEGPLRLPAYLAVWILASVRETDSGKERHRLTWLILSDCAPISAWKQALVVARLAIDVVREDGNHVFICVRIQVVNVVALVQHVRYHFGFWHVCNCRRYDIRHVSVVLVFGQV
jgi:hypothetical protein